MNSSTDLSPEQALLHDKRKRSLRKPGDSRWIFAVIAAGLVVLSASAADERVVVRGELRQWHKVTVQLEGPHASETDMAPNPFRDLRFDVTFMHESGEPVYRVPGYFAADGNAAETGAVAGSVWRAHFAPDKAGVWTYRLTFIAGAGAAITGVGTSLAPYDGSTGRFTIGPSDKSGADFRARGRLEYVGRHHLRFAGSGDYFFKAGPDSPETLLAYRDFDGTVAGKEGAPLKTWSVHVQDWRLGDPEWRNGLGRGLIGAINYLSKKGLNTISFLPYNAGGDGDNVWPFVSRNDKFHYDCSKLDQWGIVFDYAQTRGLHLHFKLQENEMDDERIGPQRDSQKVPEALDGGVLGPERKLYLREIIARFGHALALTWNLGEENTQTSDEQRAMARFIRETHYYSSNLVLHTFTNEQELLYEPLLGRGSALTGVSLQNDWAETPAWTRHWVRASRLAGRPWVVSNDEQGNWAYGVPPDPGYAGFSGIAPDLRRPYGLNEVRKITLWGNFMAGGAGVEYYFGYMLPQHDITGEDFRSRDRSWDYCRIALEFIRDEKIPFWKMESADEIVGNSIGAESYHCLALPGELYLVYLPWGDVSSIDFRGVTGEFQVKWFNPRAGGALIDGPVTRVSGGRRIRIGLPPEDPHKDWLIVIRRIEKFAP